MKKEQVIKRVEEMIDAGWARFSIAEFSAAYDIVDAQADAKNKKFGCGDCEHFRKSIVSVTLSEGTTISTTEPRCEIEDEICELEERLCELRKVRRCCGAV